MKRLKKNQTAKYKYEFFYDKEFENSHRTYYEENYLGITIVKFENIE